jgi:tripartite-type tricarboxylate transporter receptor subunit TctC
MNPLRVTAPLAQFLLTGCLVLAATCASAQDVYPSWPVTVVVPFPAGGAADSAYRTVADLIAAAKAKPGQVAYASSGNYGPSHLPAAMLAHAAGVQFNHIPYTGGAPMITSLLGGQVEFAVFSRSLISSHVESGKLRYLASYGTERWTGPQAPPSLGQSGVHINYVNWLGVFAPAQTSPDVIQRVQLALRTATQDAGFVDVFSKSGGTVSYLDGAEFQKYGLTEIQQTRDVIRKIGRIE